MDHGCRHDRVLDAISEALVLMVQGPHGGCRGCPVRFGGVVRHSSATPLTQCVVGYVTAVGLGVRDVIARRDRPPCRAPVVADGLSGSHVDDDHGVSVGWYCSANNRTEAGACSRTVASS